MAALAVVLYCGTAHAGGSPVSVQLIPDEVLFPPPMADPFAPIPSLKYFHTSRDENYFARVTAGATFGLMRINIGSAAVQISGQGAIMGRLHLAGSVMAETTDFRIGAPIDIAWPGADRGWIFEINPYHTSSHLNDDRIFENADTGNRAFSASDLNLPVNYTRDVVELTTAYRFFEIDRIYASYAVLSDGRGLGRLSDYRTGSELFGPAFEGYGCRIQPYLAENLRTQKETDWTVDLNVQAGFALNRTGGRHRLRFAVEYLIGSSAEGQLNQRKERNIGIGLSFDL